MSQTGVHPNRSSPGRSDASCWRNQHNDQRRVRTFGYLKRTANISDRLITHYWGNNLPETEKTK